MGSEYSPTMKFITVCFLNLIQIQELNRNFKNINLILIRHATIVGYRTAFESVFLKYYK